MPRLLVAVLVLALLVPRPASVAAQEEGPDLVALVTAYTAAWNAHDLDALMARFAEDAVVRLLDDASGKTTDYVGQDRVQFWAQERLAHRSRIEVANHQASGNTVRWDYREFREPDTSLGIEPLEGTTEASFQAGKITRLSLTVSSASVRRRTAAVDAALAARVIQASAGSAEGEGQRQVDTQARRTPSRAHWIAGLVAIVLVIGLAVLKRPHSAP